MMKYLLFVKNVKTLLNFEGDVMSKILVLDTETGGLNPDKHSILSYGAVILDDFKIIDQIEVYVNEGNIIAEESALRVNKIDLKYLVEHGYSPLPAVELLENFLLKHFNFLDCTKYNLINMSGHNIGFDVGFMKRLYRLAGREYEKVFSHRTLDTAGIIRFLNVAGVSDLSSSSSDKAFDYFRIVIPEEKRHTALGDAIGTAELLVELVYLVKNKGDSLSPRQMNNVMTGIKTEKQP